MTTIIAFIVIFCILVVVHEFGHFYFAKRSGILVREFSIGWARSCGRRTRTIRPTRCGCYHLADTSAWLAGKMRRTRLNPGRC